MLERLGSHRSRHPCLSPQRTTYSPAPSTGADMSCLSPAVLIPSASPHSLPLRPPRPVPSWLCGPALHHATMPFCSEHRASASWDALVGRQHRASMLRRLRRLRCVPASPPHTRSLICPRNADPVADVCECKAQLLTVLAEGGLSDPKGAALSALVRNRKHRSISPDASLSCHICNT